MITEPSEIEFYLLLRNRRHFGQAQGSPFTIPPLHDDINWSASSPAADQLLAGQYTTIIDTPQCMALLQACKAAAEQDVIPDVLTHHEFKSKICSWRESTTTSPSGRHLGRYRALFAKSCYHPVHQETEHMNFQAKQRAIAELILSIMNYAIRRGYVLQRWKTIVNTMIFKDPGNIQIHRLWVIHIYEADFNLLLHHADSSRLINDGQYGGRPGCEAQSLALFEELKYDIAYT